MNESCDRIQELILQALSGALPLAEERAVAEHVAECAACREFQDAVRRDDQQLTAYADAVSRSISDLPERVAAALENRAIETPRPIPLWRKIMRSPISRISTAAAVVVAVVVTVMIGGRQTAWAQIVESLQKAQRVHVVVLQTRPDGKIEKTEVWAEKPNRERHEDSLGVTVDDGVNHLVLDRAKKTAQLSDSKSASEEPDIFKSVEILQMFKASATPGVSLNLTPLPDEKAGAVKVYSMEVVAKGQNVVPAGKIWIQADTRLPLRFEMINVKSEAIAITWSYDPIPPELFSTAVPAGYTELPRYRHPALRGRVLDEHGAPVVGAVVYATTSGTMTGGANDAAFESTSDARGKFEIKLPGRDSSGPGVQPPPARFPIFVAAFRRDDPDRVAWTVLTADKSKKFQPAGRTLPGDPGECETASWSSPGESICGGASGIVLNMEPAGRIHGTVTGLDGTPIRGAEIFIEPMLQNVGNMICWVVHPRGPASPKNAGATSDAQGRYELTNVPRIGDKCEVYMRIRAAGCVDGYDSFTPHGPLVSQEMNFRLYKAALTVTGRAVSDRGEPLAGYEVRAVVEGDTKCAGYQEKVEADGRFTLQGCPDTPKLRIRLSGEYPPGLNIHGTSTLPNPSKVFYPNVEAGIKYEAGKTKYELNLVAEMPAIALRIVVKDSAGLPVPYFPVQLRHGCVGSIWSNWGLFKRTDVDGVCVLTGVPRSEGMTLFLSPSNRGYWDRLPALTPEQQKVAAGNAKFKPVEPPVNLAPDRNGQTIEVILLTQKESEAQTASPK